MRMSLQESRHAFDASMIYWSPGEWDVLYTRRASCEPTLVSILSVSSKSLSKTATCDSSAVRAFPNLRCTLCMLTPSNSYRDWLRKNRMAAKRYGGIKRCRRVFVVHISSSNPPGGFVVQWRLKRLLRYLKVPTPRHQCQAIS